MTNAPSREPGAVGVNVTSTVQRSPGATMSPAAQVLLGAMAKSPLAARLRMRSPTALVFTIVTVREGLVVPTGRSGNVRSDGVRSTVGVTPEPDSETLCGLPDASLGMLMVPDAGPAEAGVNLAATLHV